MSTSPGRLTFLLVALVAVLAATLFPAAGGEPGDWIACLLCADRVVADILVNIILFLPLGAGLAAQGWSARRCIVLAAVVSAGIEYAQLFVPNRDSSIADIVSNTIGAATGIGLVRTAAAWLTPGRRAAARLSLGAALAAAATFVASGALLAPSFPAAPFFAEWTPNLPGLEWYRGRVLDVTTGGLSVPSGIVADSGQLRDLLLADSGFSLSVRALAGPPTSGIGTIVRIADAEPRELLLLGVDGRDVVFRVRTRAAGLRLDQPDLRLADGMEAVSPGDTIEAAVRGRAGQYCISLNHRAACDLGFRVANAWALLFYPDTTGWIKMLLDAGWMAGLLLLPGFWARSRAVALGAASIAAAGLVLTPLVVPVLPSSPGDWLAAGVGFVLGAGAQRLIGDTASPRQPELQPPAARAKTH